MKIPYTGVRLGMLQGLQTLDPKALSSLIRKRHQVRLRKV